jgi:hypothetical protein
MSVVSAFLFFGVSALAYQCPDRNSVCQAVSDSDAVFIGKVESVYPERLARWDKSQLSFLDKFNQTFVSQGNQVSGEQLAEMKAAFLQLFPHISEGSRENLKQATTVARVAALFNFELDRGSTARFRVSTVFKYEEDDEDDAEGAAKEAPPQQVDIRLPLGPHDLDLQVGETYLVYASFDEGTPLLSSDRCSRTRRLSNAGEDLAFLHFYKTNRKESARLEGAVTHEKSGTAAAPEPAANVIVQLKSASVSRYAEADSSGRYVFEGLAAGDYRITVFRPGYLADSEPLANPYEVHLDESGCLRHNVTLRKR